MNLRPGQKVGPYKIVSELGRGGMAVVYKAWQPSLERHVALKVLPPYFGHEPEFLSRFQREARAAARLNHPSIVTIHDVGQAQGIHYIAMEHLEGGSLRHRLESGRIGRSESLRIFHELASALDYAHARGMIHRDIKPGNILFTADGRSKIADFGIARPSDEAQLTRTGALMGTPDYMAPEQAEGRRVDHRADLYALGVVLYQMVTGVVPFRRTTPHATLHAVVYEEPPPPSTVNPHLSSAAEQVILKSLAKRPEARYQSGAAFSAALRKASAARPGTRAEPREAAKPSRKRRRSPLVWTLGLTAFLLLIVLGLLFLLAGGGDLTGLTWGPTLPGKTQTSASAAATAAGGLPERGPSSVPGDSLAQERAVATPASTGIVPSSATSAAEADAPTPFFGHLAFTSTRDGNAEIYAVELGRGDPLRLTSSASDDWLPDWSADGSRIAFTSSRSGGYDLWTMTAGGSDTTAKVATAAWDEYARWAPDGRRLAFASTAESQGVPNSEIFVWSPGEGAERLTDSPAENQWPDWSPEGRIIYSEGWKGTANWDIWLVDSDGGNRVVWLGGSEVDVQATWSRDGKRVAFLRISEDTSGNGELDEEDRGDIWMANANAANLRRLTSGLWAINPAWSPDRKWIAFALQHDSNENGRSDGGDASDIYAVRVADGELVPLVTSRYQDYAPAWTD